MRRQLARFLELCADSLRRAGLEPAAGTFPIENHFVGHEALDRVGHIREPRATAQLAIGEDLHAGFFLPVEDAQDGAIFGRAQFLELQFACGVIDAGF